MTLTKSLVSMKATPTREGADLDLVWRYIGPVPCEDFTADGKPIIAYKQAVYEEPQRMRGVPWEMVDTMRRVWGIK